MPASQSPRRSDPKSRSSSREGPVRIRIIGGNFSKHPYVPLDDPEIPLSLQLRSTDRQCGLIVTADVIWNNNWCHSFVIWRYQTIAFFCLSSSSVKWRHWFLWGYHEIKLDVHCTWYIISIPQMLFLYLSQKIRKPGCQRKLTSYSC